MKKRKAHDNLSLHFQRCHKGGRGEEKGFLNLGAQPLDLCSPLLFPPLPSRRSLSDSTLCSSSSARAGPSLPTSVVDRKSSTALVHLSSASRSLTFQRLFHFPVSFLTSAHRVFCCSFHSTHSLKRWSRVCVSHAHHQHWGEGRLFVRCRCCPVRQ